MSETAGDPPTPENFQIPTIDELDQMRTELGLSQRDLSRRAGMDENLFNTILHRDMDPQTSTMRALLQVLREAEPRTADEIERRGPKPESSSLASKLESMTPEEAGLSNRGDGNV